MTREYDENEIRDEALRIALEEGEKARADKAKANGGNGRASHRKAQEARAARLFGATRQNKRVLVTVASVEEEKDQRPSHAEILRLLEAMDDVEYDRRRRALAREWGLQLITLDRMRKHAKLRQEYAQPKEPQPDPDELKHRLAYIWQTEGILDLWLKSWDKVMAGEHRNAMLLYLIATSRLFDKPMNVAIKGPSSGGKSEIRRQVLEFFPPEDVVVFTVMSEKALLYHEGDFCHKILSMAEACSVQEQELQDLLLRELMSEGKVVYLCVQKIHGQLVTRKIEKHGPVAFCVTTTKAALHPENETRMLSLEIDDSEAQTKRVLEKLAETTGKNDRPDDSIHYDWQDFQRLLRMVGNKNVVVPFADALAALIPPRATRLRRDFSQIICAIKAHALIHCCRRMNNEKGELMADLDLDYVPVAELVGHITAEGAGIAVSKELLETIGAVEILTVKLPTDDGVTAFEVGKKLGLDKSTAHRRLQRGVERGFVVNMELHRNRPGKYRLTDMEVEAGTLLPSADAIRNFIASS
jgi:hypothetical protein